MLPAGSQRCEDVGGRCAICWIASRGLPGRAAPIRSGLAARRRNSAASRLAAVNNGGKLAGFNGEAWAEQTSKQSSKQACKAGRQARRHGRRRRKFCVGKFRQASHKQVSAGLEARPRQAGPGRASLAFVWATHSCRHTAPRERHVNFTLASQDLDMMTPAQGPAE
ncbi:uncharacterized protein PSFLO_05277 [Pseudozyma flocculosa]|uniref:Uncharacterized protein n=1 Tax=Pseudozyma flocculosa TaxID=84751 RepID=A0A5C3F6W2_9BASI|nr:uncharacterized protein PSFLO_05277 [Pseudozyma flocculosa]